MLTRALRYGTAVVMLLAGFAIGSAQAAQLTLTWDPNPESDIAGYLVSWGDVSHGYTSSVDVGNSTIYQFTEPDPSKVFYIAVRAYNTSGLVGPYSNEIATTPVVAPLILTSLAANRTSPQPIGTPIAFSAIATGGIAPYQFKWWINDGTSVSVGQPWSASSTFTVTPGAPSTRYIVAVWARNAGDTVDAPANPNAALGMTFAITPPLALTQLTANKTSPQPAGAPITFNAAATGGTGPYQYKWWINDGTSVSVGQSWSTSDTFTVVPGSPSATYIVAVWARNAGDTIDAPANANAARGMIFQITP